MDSPELLVALSFMNECSMEKGLPKYQRDVIDFTIFLLVSNANLYFIKPPANKPYVKNAKIFHKWPVFD